MPKRIFRIVHTCLVSHFLASNIPDRFYTNEQDAWAYVQRFLFRYAEKPNEYHKNAHYSITVHIHQTNEDKPC